MTIQHDSRDAQPAASAAAQRCAQCGAPFRCGVRTGDATCWCASLPALPMKRIDPLDPLDPLDADAACLCPACLARRVARG